MNPKRIHIESYGCTSNLADGEVLAGCLRAAGFLLTDSKTEADLIVYNCCSVKGPTENRMIDLVAQAPNGKKVIVAGCLPLTSYERLRERVRFDGLIGPAAGMTVVDIVKRVLHDEQVVALDKASLSKPEFSLPRFRGSSVVSLVPVSYGCLGACAYCCVVIARGRLRSYTLEEIVQRIECDAASGTQEIWLTSQDMACYGRDLGTTLPALIKAVCAVPGNFHIRVGMMTPNFTLEMLPKLVEAFKDEKVFKFIHLPVQSGDNKVLRAMNRCYSVKDFKTIVRTFRATFPEITLATDVICGFPGESKDAFNNTLRLIDEVQPDIVNISKFFARPKTAAASITDGVVGQSEIKRRSAELAQLTKRISLGRNQRWRDWTGTILVDEKGKVSGSWVGRNFAYKPITVKSTSNLLGKTFSVNVKDVFYTYLNGEIAK